MHSMKDIDEIRRDNLRLLEQEYGGPTATAAQVGMSTAQFANLRDGARDSKTGKPRGMRKDTARKIEQNANKPTGWLDVDHSSASAELSNKSQNGGMITPSQDPPGLSMESGHAIPLTYPARQTGIRRVFVVGRAQGGLPERLWTDGDYPVGATDEYTEIATNDAHAFLTPVVGTSMIPRFNPGEFAFVSPALDPHAGDDVLVRLRSGQTLLKRLASTRGGVVELHSYNEAEQKPLFYPQDDISWMYYVGYPVPSRMVKHLT